MSAADTSHQSTAVIYLRPFGGAAAPAPEIHFTPVPRRIYERENVDALLLIIRQLYGALAEKDAEVEFLRRTARETEQRLTHSQVSVVGLVAAWGEG